jgi:uncharacterized protein (DUF486 family)
MRRVAPILLRYAIRPVAVWNLCSGRRALLVIPTADPANHPGRGFDGLPRSHAMQKVVTRALLATFPIILMYRPLTLDGNAVVLALVGAGALFALPRLS